LKHPQGSATHSALRLRRSPGWSSFSSPRNTRFLRIALAVRVGASPGRAVSLPAAGVRGPLAEPGTIGVSSGAAVGAGASISLGLDLLGTWTLPTVAFVAGPGAVLPGYAGRLRPGAGRAVHPTGRGGRPDPAAADPDGDDRAVADAMATTEVTASPPTLLSALGVRRRELVLRVCRERARAGGVGAADPLGEVSTAGRSRRTMTSRSAGRRTPAPATCSCPRAEALNVP
jgi:hypothetical protein